MRWIGWAAKRWTRALAGAALLLAGTLALAEAPAPATAARPAAPRPAIWLLEDADTKIYLFGTTHMFERGLAWRSPRLDAIVREADELVTETGDDGEEMDEAEAAALMFMDKPVPILSRVSETHRPRLRRIVEASGLPFLTWDRLDSWAAAVMIMTVAMLEGMSEEERAAHDPFDALMSGAEVELSAEFRRAGKPISGVESSAFQMELLRTLSLPAQRAFLEMTLDDIARAEDPATVGNEAAWVTGNVEEIAREMEAMPPVLYEALLTRRNRAWTEWLARRLDKPGTILFAVGAGHLAGRDSVQSMLAARGLSARRID